MPCVCVPSALAPLARAVAVPRFFCVRRCAATAETRGLLAFLCLERARVSQERTPTHTTPQAGAGLALVDAGLGPCVRWAGDARERSSLFPLKTAAPFFWQKEGASPIRGRIPPPPAPTTHGRGRHLCLGGTGRANGRGEGTGNRQGDGREGENSRVRSYTALTPPERQPLQKVKSKHGIRARQHLPHPPVPDGHPEFDLHRELWGGGGGWIGSAFPSALSSSACEGYSPNGAAEERRPRG